MLKILLVSIFVAASVLGCASRQPAVPRAASEPGMLEISGGRFTMGADEGEINERPSHPVEIGTFAMDRTEVSALEFSEFLNVSGNHDDIYFTADEYATVVAVPESQGKPRSGYAARTGFERYPANNVSWMGADTYCRWRGKRLPTEAEWEKAARGTDKRRFPWGAGNPREGLARFEQDWPARRFNVLVPVDDLPEGSSPYGLLNMAGNVLEWVNDWYRQNLCDFCNPEREANLELIRRITARDPGSADAGLSVAAADKAAASEERLRQLPPRNNPVGPTTGVFRVLRGGSWQDREGSELSTTRRHRLEPWERFPNTGFRCAKDVPATR